MSEVELYLGDCLEILPTLADNSVDAVITDPPYGRGKNNIIPGSRSKKSLADLTDYGDLNWDKREPERVRLCLEIGKPTIIFGGNYYSDVLPISPGWIVWDKQNTSNFSDCELIWTSYSKALRKIEWMWNGMIRKGGDKRVHPTQKPVGVMKWIIENYIPENATILDPFMGSGTTGVACVQTGRNFIGIEIEEKYYKIAEKRIKEAQMQLRLGI